MRILLSNDDGYRSEGIECLAEALATRADVVVVAPERDRSGASNSLTLDAPMRVNRAENGFLYVDGTPTDCVHLAITGLLDKEPDMVISGINRGPNLGDDVLYSGTVAAAMEGRFLGLPAMAISLALGGAGHYETAAWVVQRLLDHMQRVAIPSDTLLNVNVPDLPIGGLGGFEVTRLGNRHRAERIVEARDPRGRPIYWIGPPGSEQDAGPGTDFHAVRGGRVSVTPVLVDLTRHSRLEQIAAWVQGVEDDA